MLAGPLVSIGIPVYNGDKYLDECLRSIHKQTYENWECFVINNQSKDRTLEIGEKYATLDARIKVITNTEFVDMTTNFNNTIKPISSEAKYFKVVCADDWIYPEYLEKMVAVMEQYPSAGICSSYRLDNRKVGCDGLDSKKGALIDGKEILLDQLYYKIDVTGSETTVLYRLETLKKLPSFPIIFSYNSYHFDTSLAFELFNISDLGFVYQVLSYTRRHEETYTSQYVFRFRTTINLREKELFKYKSRFPQLEKEYKKVRAEYGFYMLKKHIIRDIKCIEWHAKHIDANRQFGFIEFMKIVPTIYLIKVINKLRKVFKK